MRVAYVTFTYFSPSPHSPPTRPPSLRLSFPPQQHAGWCWVGEQFTRTDKIARCTIRFAKALVGQLRCDAHAHAHAMRRWWRRSVEAVSTVRAREVVCRHVRSIRMLARRCSRLAALQDKSVAFSVARRLDAGHCTLACAVRPPRCRALYAGVCSATA